MISSGKKSQLREDAEKHLEAFKMLSADEQLKKDMEQKEGQREAKIALVLKDIGNYIMKNGKISRRLLIVKLKGIINEEELRRTNIFAYHHSTNCYSFATRALKTVYQVVYLTLLSVLIIIYAYYYCCLGYSHWERRRVSSGIRVDGRNQKEQSFSIDLAVNIRLLRVCNLFVICD
jgi:hypothetical protein